MALVDVNNKKLITTAQKEITAELIKEAIRLHQTALQPGYVENENMYLSKHEILTKKKKEAWKADNRLVINYAKYIVDTFSGYQIGVPVKVSHENEAVNTFITEFRQRNDMEDNEFELAKMADVFGHAFLYVYQDEEGQTRTTYNSPINMFIVHDDSVEERPFFAVRYSFKDNEGSGELITENELIDFIFDEGSVALGDPIPHVYHKLPVIELIENEERQGIFDSTKTLINGLNKVASEKANDVEFFSDAYLKIIGVEIDEETISGVVGNRVLNLWTNDPNSPLPEASFLEKPNADSTQENLITLLKESIFAVSMVANLSEQDFGNASGTALAFKLQAMDNLAKMKDRKMQSAFKRLYEIVFSVPKSTVDAKAWLTINYQFTRNVPRNVLEEAQIVAQLSGQVSNETKLSVLSVVDNPKEELKKMQTEESNDSRLSKELERNKRLLADKDVMTDDNSVLA